MTTANKTTTTIIKLTADGGVKRERAPQSAMQPQVQQQMTLANQHHRQRRRLEQFAACCAQKLRLQFVLTLLLAALVIQSVCCIEAAAGTAANSFTNSTTETKPTAATVNKTQKAENDKKLMRRFGGYPSSQSIRIQQRQDATAAAYDASDYIDEAGELDIIANQQQIPTAQLLAAAGHSVPDNYFLPGGTVPALVGPFGSQQSSAASNHGGDLQQAAAVTSSSSSPSGRYARELAAYNKQQSQQQQQDLSDPLIDFNAFNLATGGESPTSDLIDFGASDSGASYTDQTPPPPPSPVYSQQQQAAAVGQYVDELGRDQYLNAAGSYGSIGPAYQIYSQVAGPSYQQQQQYQQTDGYAGASSSGGNGGGGGGLGTPTKSSTTGADLRPPFVNPKHISSPLIDFLATQVPKTSSFEKFTNTIPHPGTPTIFSFASSKDPVEKVKAVNGKKRNVMRQAEQIARMMIKSINEKFGTNIGDQTDIPFLLSTIGPLGFAQNLLSDPSLFVTLLNTAEKTYLSDVLPGGAKMALKPVLNMFRMPNKKRDTNANLLNIISYLKSGGQQPTNIPPRHRQGTGIDNKRHR